MAIFSSCWCTNIFGVIVVCVVGIWTYIRWVFKYWERRNVPYIEPHFPFGTIPNPFRPKDSFGWAIKKQYTESKQKGLQYVGIFITTKPGCLLIDLESIRNILSADFNYFMDRGIFVNEKDDPLSAHLFSLEGSRWKTLRAKLTPTFTSGKMKMMFPLMLECAQQMIEAIGHTTIDESIDIKDWLGRFGTDVIGTCAFGIDCNSFKEPNSDFRVFGKRSFTLTRWEMAKHFLAFSSKKLAKMLGMRMTPTEVSDFFLNMITDTVKQREGTTSRRKDFLQILLDLKNQDDHEDQHLTIEELAAQAYLFFVAGFETSSTTLAFCLYELATNPGIQERVREEVNTVLRAHGDQLTYEGVKEMRYMRQVIDETLRKYPPLQHLVRMCVKDYKVPGTTLTIEKGTSVVVSASGLHYDPEYHPDPETFDSERFNADRKNQIKPFTYMPFGEGPRMCIGLRFGLMQVSVGLSTLLKTFRFTLSEKTKIPLKFNPHSFLLSVVGDIWLHVEKVKH